MIRNQIYFVNINKYINKIILLILCSFVFIPLKVFAQHPRILVHNSDKKIILNKIKHDVWADSIYHSFIKSVTPYVDRHQKNPQWILSRYLMNWKKRDHYTRFQSDPAGTRLISESGNAPVPTVRVTTNKRPPVSKDGYGFRVPKLKELVPYDTRKVMHLQSKGPGHKWEWVDPKSMISSINGKINLLALKSSIIYWLTGNEKYAKFSADILMQWARGASYQNPIKGSKRCGYFCMQTLGDVSYSYLALTYDFVYPYLVKKDQNTKLVNHVLKQLCETQIDHGFSSNNWFAAETPTLVWSALALDNKSTRDSLMRFYINKNHNDHGFGQLSIKTAVKRFIDKHGHWKEAPNYNNYPISHLFESALAAENNGYPIFGKYPKLFKSASVMYRYSFPNDKAMAFGDCHERTHQSPELLEIGILMAEKYHRGSSDTLSFILHKLINDGFYQRKNSGFLGLLCYKGSIKRNAITYINLPRTASLYYARCYLQRNVNHRFNLMSYVQGATYNHNHANGMAMELYGDGYVLGDDPGADVSYSTRKHGEYYIQIGAHNTVVSAPQLRRKTPFTMGPRHIGHISLVSMEPMPKHKAVSPYYSFTTTSYLDTTTKILTHQLRTMAVVRTSQNSGYYIDIFRSDNPIENDYVYHNIGHSLKILNKSNSLIPVKSTNALDYDFGRHGTGFQFFKDKYVVKNYSGTVDARFALNKKSFNQKENVYMNVWMTGSAPRNYFRAKAPRSHTAPYPYNQLLTPTLIVQKKGKAWNHPFVAVYEPYKGKSSYHVRGIQRYESPKGTSIFCVNSMIGKYNLKNYIFDSVKNSELRIKGNTEMKGNFGIVSVEDGHLKSLYLGDGSKISFKNYAIISKNGNSISSSLTIKKGNIYYSSDEPAIVVLPYKTSKNQNRNNNNLKIQYSNGKIIRITKYDIVKKANKNYSIRFELPEIKNIQIIMN